MDQTYCAPPPGEGDPIMRTVSATLNDTLGSLVVEGLFPSVSSDYIVLFLDEQTSQQPSLDGQTRGTFEFAAFPRPQNGDLEPVVMLGRDLLWSERTLRTVFTWQDCTGEVNFGETRHSCDTVPGVSGSVIAVFEEGEFRALAAQTRGTLAGEDDALVPLPDWRGAWNRATTLSVVLDALRVQGR